MSCSSPPSSAAARSLAIALFSIQSLRLSAAPPTRFASVAPMLSVIALTAICAVALILARPLWHPLRVALAGTRSVEEVVLEFGPTVTPLLSTRLLAAGLDATPDALILVAL